MTKKLKHHIVIHLENLDIIGKLGALFVRVSGIYKKGFENAQQLNIVEHQVFFRNLPAAFDGYRIIAMGDLHIDGKLDLVGRIRQLLQRVDADACVFLGDYRAKVIGPYKHVIDKMAEIVSAVNARDGIFGVRGNHDSEAMVPELNRIGIRMLVNESVKITRGEQAVYLIGVDDPHLYENDDIEQALEDVPDDAFKIMLVHSPEIHWRAARKGVDFYICGHTHGGQIALKKSVPIIVNARNSRRQAYRFWRDNGMLGYTTLGVGTSSVPVRFNCPPEIVVFTLRHGEPTKDNSLSDVLHFD